MWVIMSFVGDLTFEIGVAPDTSFVGIAELAVRPAVLMAVTISRFALA